MTNLLHDLAAGAGLLLAVAYVITVVGWVSA